MIKTGKQVKGLISNGDNEIMEILNLISDAEILEMYRNYGVTLLQAMLKDIKEDKKLVNEIKTVTGKNKAGNKAGNKITKAGNKAGNKITKAGNKAGNKITKKINDDEIDDEIEEVYPVEFFIPKFGMFTIPKPIFELFMKEFNFSANEAHRKVVNLFIYYPKRVPLIAINIGLDSYMLETLFTDSFEEYLLLEDEEKCYQTFCGLFSQQVFSLLAALGTKTIRRGDKVVHVTPQVISFEGLYDKELSTIEEEELS